MQARIDGVQHASGTADAEVQLQVAIAVPGQGGDAVGEQQVHPVQGVGHLPRPVARRRARCSDGCRPPRGARRSRASPWWRSAKSISDEISSGWLCIKPSMGVSLVIRRMRYRSSLRLGTGVACRRRSAPDLRPRGSRRIRQAGSTGKRRALARPWTAISIAPPMACITRWQNIRPMPLPPDCARVVTGSRVSLASTSGGMPGPLSVKRIQAARPSTPGLAARPRYASCGCAAAAQGDAARSWSGCKARGTAGRGGRASGSLAHVAGHP